MISDLDATRCLGCGICVEVCPLDVLRLDASAQPRRAYVAYGEDCMTCFECEVRCPSNAIKVHPFKEVLPPTLTAEGGSDGRR
ncbi:MAG: ferredoxin family protein [Deltaproteobacteria bacterium]|nr:ferredoxin family protein [Deltaproteobacteria bacterium]